MKYFAFIILTLLLFVVQNQSHAQSKKEQEAKKAVTVLNHLMTIGRNDEGFETLPKNATINGWNFEKYSDRFYYVVSPKGPSRRRYEYRIDPKTNLINQIAIAGGSTDNVLYDRETCYEVLKASVNLKNEEALSDKTSDILKANRVQGPYRDQKDTLFGRAYAKNCALIFELDEKKAAADAAKEQSKPQPKKSSGKAGA